MKNNPFLKGDNEKKKQITAKQAAAKQATDRKSSDDRQAAASSDLDWYNEDGESPGGNEDGDEMGFRMLEGEALKAAVPKSDPSQVENKRPSIIRSLIDFSECDVADEEPTVPVPVVVPSCASDSNGHFSQNAATNDGLADREAVQAEVDHLRRMLQDVRAEGSIQVEILNEDLSKKKEQIDALLAQKAKLEKEQKEAEAGQVALQNQKEPVVGIPIADDGLPASVQAQVDGDLEALRTEVAHLRAAAPRSGFSDCQDLVSSLKSLQRTTFFTLKNGSGANGAGTIDVGEEPEIANDSQGLESDLRGLVSVAQALHQEALRAAAEHQRLSTDIAWSRSNDDKDIVDTVPRATMDSSSEPESQVVSSVPSTKEVHEATRRAMSAISEVRRSCEKQLDWLSTRIQTMKQAREKLAGSSNPQSA
eukprot:gnl/MRDRNA2_/MRDRNA2_51652_c0_seq1.p1 gnl/MRDRNA2_/MRDRNA2_51652_c0~~gnl/MRDRNA2_/MRDRNA2_51652_c0_seq1.p1  ORF type:complete len:421 (-),score=115.70 gnl/MRDRNA2_/MRDRNA2_51652_c0_seq1:100-1362(-)